MQKHLEHLYRKLGVRDRLMAVQRARDAGLLAPPPEPGARRGTTAPTPLVPLPRSEDQFPAPQASASELTRHRAG